MASETEQHDLAEFVDRSPRPDIRLIASDIDGTLVNDAKAMHDEFWPLIDELHQRGVVFCPASGRQYEALRVEFAPVADELAYIAENGAYVLLDGKEIHSDTLDLNVAQQLVAAVRSVPQAWAVLCGKASAYVERSEAEFLTSITPYYGALTIVDDLLDVTDDEILKLAVFDAIDAEVNCGPALSEFADRAQLTLSGKHWLDVMSPTASKGVGVAKLQAALGIGPDNTMVFGDFLNDLEMMDSATYSFAMANAHPELKQRAAWTAPTNNANGVVRTIRTVMGIPER